MFRRKIGIMVYYSGKQWDFNRLKRLESSIELFPKMFLSLFLFFFFNLFSKNFGETKVRIDVIIFIRESKSDILFE